MREYCQGDGNERGILDGTGMGDNLIQRQNVSTAREWHRWKHDDINNTGHASTFLDRVTLQKNVYGCEKIWYDSSFTLAPSPFSLMPYLNFN